MVGTPHSCEPRSTLQTCKIDNLKYSINCLNGVGFPYSHHDETVVETDHAYRPEVLDSAVFTMMLTVYLCAYIFTGTAKELLVYMCM